MGAGSYRVDTTWGVLIGLAIATLWLPPLVPSAVPANALLLTLAAIKGRGILLNYLGLRDAPPIWRGLVSTWLLLVLAFAWIVSALALLI
jgi:hypothetical protein